MSTKNYWSKSVIFTLLGAVIIFWGYANFRSADYIAFVPMTHRESKNGELICDVDITESFYENVKILLRFYKIDYKSSLDGRVLIRASQAQDEIWLAEMTTMAKSVSAMQPIKEIVWAKEQRVQREGELKDALHRK